MVEFAAPPRQPLGLSRDLYFRVVLAALTLSTIYFFLLGNVADFDLWGLLSFGALAEQGPFPRVDPFSYTAPGAPWIFPDWGSGVLFHRLLGTWGDSGLFVLKMLLFAMTLTMAAAIHRLESEDHESKTSAATLFLLGLPGCYLLLNSYLPTLRSQAFSVLGYVAFLWILDGYRRFPSTRAPWLLPPFLAVWINMHGGFVLALFVIGVHLLWLIAERRKNQATELAIVTLFCLGALLLNPYGLRFFPAIFEAWTVSRAGISEWGDVFSNGTLYAWTYTVLAGAAVAAAAVNAWRRRRFPGALILLTATAVEGFLHVRLVPYFVFTLLALGGGEFLRLLTRYDPPRRLADLFCLVLPAGSAAAALTLIGLQFLSGNPVLRPRVPAGDVSVQRPAGVIRYPLGAAALLAEMQSPVNLWCPLPWGGFLSWSLHPNVRVSMDGRFEKVFPGSVRRAHQRFWSGVRNVYGASEYDTTHILVPADDRATLAAVDASGWVRIYEDPVAVLYGRGPAAPAAARDNRSTFVGDVRGVQRSLAPR